jgi:hypothetical protein
MRFQARFAIEKTVILLLLLRTLDAGAITVDGPLSVVADFGPPTTDAAYFGAALAINGDLAVVGSPHQTDASGNINFADVFTRGDSGTWNFSIALPHYLDRTVTNIYFTGNSLAIDSSNILLGEQLAEVWPNILQGEIDLYRQVPGGWRLLDNFFDYETGVTGDRLGSSLAISGDVLVAGAAADELLAGATYLFARSGNSWRVQERLVPMDGATGDRFGLSIAIDGNVLVVGAPGASYAGSSAGAVYVYNFNGSNWVQAQKLISTNPTDGGSFGGKVAISGNWMAVSAPLESVSGKFDAGHVYMYQRAGSSWSLKQDFTSTTPLAGEAFGSAVDIKGQALVIGALGSGSAIVFHRTSSTWSSFAKLMDAPDSEFGAAVAISPTNGEIMIGAPTESSYKGHVYVFSADEIFSNGYE